MTITISIWSLLIAIASCSPAGLGSGPINHKLDVRDNPISCGFNNLFPCSAGEACYTSDNQAFCSTTSQTATSETTATTTALKEESTSEAGIRIEIKAQTCSAGQTICNGPAGLCCDSATQWCDNGLACRSYGVNSPVGSPGLPPTTVATSSSTLSGFVAPTSISVTTITSTGSQTGTATTTEPFETPIGSSGATLPSVTAEPQTGGGGGLSAGAIAGIVIGVLVGLFILFIVLACLCCKGIFDLIFGRNKKKETTTTVYSHHSAHGDGGGRPPRRFFGLLPGREDRPDRPEKKSSGLGGLFAVGGILTALLVILGLRRKREERRTDQEVSQYTASNDYYYDDYSTSASSASSDRRTRNTHHSRSQSRR